MVPCIRAGARQASAQRCAWPSRWLIVGKRTVTPKPRRANDAYFTPPEAVAPLIPHLTGVRRFVEPCAGDGALVRALTSYGLRCARASDIAPAPIPTGAPKLAICEVDALECERLPQVRADAIITNPPYTRDVMHALIERFLGILPTWVLLEADWAYTGQAADLLARCSDIVPIGRVKWIEGSDNTGKDNFAWYRFHGQHRGATVFWPRGAV